MKPLSKPTLLMIRHGDTSMNDHDELRGWDDPPLNEEGHKQARRAADKVKQLDMPIHHIYSGTLDRTKSTAAHISAATGVQTSQTEKLNPWDYGDFTGLPENHANRKKLQFLQDRPDIPAPGGESYGSFVTRYGEALLKAKAYVHKFPEKAVVLVTHSRNLYPTKNILDEGKSKIPTKDPEFGPGTVHKIEFDPGGSGKFSMGKV